MRRRFFLSLSASAALPPAGNAAPSSAARVYSLDGEWTLSVQGRSKPARVPGVMQEAFPAFHGLGWYERDFAVPAHPDRDGRYLLRFHAVDYLSEVWVNGMRAGAHEGGETPFEFDVTALVKPLADNHLKVRVLNPTNERIDGITIKETPHRNKEVPFRPGAFYNEGGILEGVELVLAPPVRLTDLFVRADWKSGEVRLEATLFNATSRPANPAVEFFIAPVMASVTVNRRLAPGSTVVTAALQVPGHRLWSLASPNLYTAEVRAGVDRLATRFGFRDFRVRDGWFHLNGRRLFVKSTHTGNHTPIGQIVAPAEMPDVLRRDLLYAKAAGFNTVRFIAGVAHPDQLDLCDELGLMVYEESLAGWELADSPAMAERYERSILDMVRRDRNHPSVAMWGLLNETKDGPVFRKAVATLPALRKFDDTRLVLLGSGRWDRQWSIGSVSNPGSVEWEYVWGAEAAGAAPVPEKIRSRAGGYVEAAGDAHAYPQVPQTDETNAFLRTMGATTKPVFLSEYGIGSLFDAVRTVRQFEQVRANPDLEDFTLARSMAGKLEADWKRFAMDGVYAFPEDMLRASYLQMARQRAMGFNLVRSNPRLCGFNVTGMLDHVMTGEGFWDLWRNWKPGIVDVLQDGWAPLRWCLFANPVHGYTGRPVRIEAVLANEDVLEPGDYPAHFRILGPEGVVWERSVVAHLPESRPLAVPVLSEEVTLNAPAGVYHLAARLERGGSPRAQYLDFRLSDAATGQRQVAIEGFDAAAFERLASAGIGSAGAESKLILAGPKADWPSLHARVEQGATALFVDAPSFAKLPFDKLGHCYNSSDWLYHKESVAKRHPVFEGLAEPGVMDWDYYGQVVPRFTIDPKVDPDEVAAASFALGTTDVIGYKSGVLVASWHEGRGRLVFSTLRLVENLGQHPAAGRLLHNLLRHYSK